MGFSSWRPFLRTAGLWVARRLGSPLTDARTGQPLGRALLVPWRGRIYVIGLEQAVRPVFLNQVRLTYWRQTLGFTTHPELDFPRQLPIADNGTHHTDLPRP